MHGCYSHETGGRPRLLLAYTDPAYASECGRYFRRLGWEVEMVASGSEARELVNEYHPDVVALDADLLRESDWFMSGIGANDPNLRVVLVADSEADGVPDRLGMLGRTRVVRRDAGVEALAHTVID
jgi:DNA-binding NarL/FixJ family response regulator